MLSGRSTGYEKLEIFRILFLQNIEIKTGAVTLISRVMINISDRITGLT
jgi:hypothetical protein